MIKNITLSAEEALIQQARRRAAAENHTLNELFRHWLERYVAQPLASEQYELLMLRLNHVNAGRKFNREEMNEPMRCPGYFFWTQTSSYTRLI